jgi:hypothetical protein
VCVCIAEREREKRLTEFNELSHSGYMYPLLVMPVSRLPINFDLIFFCIIRLFKFSFGKFKFFIEIIFVTETKIVDYHDGSYIQI